MLQYLHTTLFVPQRVKKAPFSPSSLGVSGLGNREQKTSHGSLPNALIPAHKGSNFALNSRYMVYFSQI